MAGLMQGLLRRNEKRFESKEAPGFSDTMVKDAEGNWRSIDEGRDRKRRRKRAGILAMPAVHHALMD